MTDYSRVKALVVDDDPVTRAVVRESLEKLGYPDIVEARDGVDALDVLRRNPGVGLVLTDIIMPRLDGLGLVEQGKREFPDVVWVILSALDRFDKAVEAIRLGAFDFLAKPVREQELEVSIRNAVEHLWLLRERAALYAALENKVHELEDKTELLRRDLQRAEVIQKALLPNSPPRLESWKVEALYRPGRYVGGDLYDVQRLDDRRIAFYVADATGHGVTAAMLSVLFKERLQFTDVGGNPLAPSMVLRLANQALVEALDAPGLFLTVLYGLLDTETGKLVVASAGHPPALVQPLNGLGALLPRTGPALGLVEGARFDEHKIDLHAGDRVLVYTDGLLDANASGSDRVWSLMDSRPADYGTAFSRFLEQIAQARATVREDEVDDVTVLLITGESGESRYDNGSAPHQPATALRPDRTPVIYLGEADGAWYMSVLGRGTWKHSEVFFETASAILAEHHGLVLHLEDCEYLDSTMLGTVHELVARGNVKLQGVQPPVRALFNELQMQKVLDNVVELQPPPELLPIAHDAAQTDMKARILHAHQALASISSSNQDRFKDVLKAIK